MNDKIDGVFEFKSYRYVPYDLRNEWKTFYNLTSKKFYNKLHSKFNVFPYMNIDFYNEEILRINYLDTLCSNFKLQVDNLKPKFDSDIDYSEEVKQSLLVSINEIKDFLGAKKKILMNNVKDKQIPIKENNIEHFEDNSCNTIDTVMDRRPVIIFSLLFVILFYLFI